MKRMRVQLSLCYTYCHLTDVQVVPETHSARTRPTGSASELPAHTLNVAILNLGPSDRTPRDTTTKEWDMTARDA